MNCSNCKGQIASTEIYCPFCGEVNDGAGSRPAAPVYSAELVRCIHCTGMVPQGARFCGECGRDQVFTQPQIARTSTTGKVIGWTCGGCLGLIILFSVVPALIRSIFGW
jgi:RNA polymerase subunit RPABC4/transcription elongation factor Spt4